MSLRGGLLSVERNLGVSLHQLSHLSPVNASGHSPPQAPVLSCFPVSSVQADADGFSRAEMLGSLP